MTEWYGWITLTNTHSYTLGICASVSKLNWKEHNQFDSAAIKVMETVQALDIYLLVFTSFSSMSSQTEQMGVQRFFQQNWSYNCTTSFWEAAV